MDESFTVYVLQGSSGVVFMATTDRTKVKELQEKIKVETKIQYWVNGQHIFTS